MKKYNWNNAIKYAESLQLGEHSDWRLPAIDELVTLWDPNNGKSIVDCVSSNYWSSTTYAVNPDSAWGVDFYYGYVLYDYKVNLYYVRCVRGGQFDNLGNLIIPGVPDGMERIIDNGDGTVTDNLTRLVWEVRDDR